MQVSYIFPRIYALLGRAAKDQLCRRQLHHNQQPLLDLEADGEQSGDEATFEDANLITDGANSGLTGASIVNTIQRCANHKRI